MENKKISLHNHPTTPATWIENVIVTCDYDADKIILIYQIIGDITLLQLPPLSNLPNRADNLWQHTCFEAFIAEKNTTKYCEWNFSPSRQWQLYEFTNYRSSRTLPKMSVPQIYTTVTAEQFTLTAHIPNTCYPINTKLRLGLAVILQDTTNKIYYWALKHPPDEPDFHCESGWIVDF